VLIIVSSDITAGSLKNVIKTIQKSDSIACFTFWFGSDLFVQLYPVRLPLSMNEHTECEFKAIQSGAWGE
jgi:hypothetical protein